MENKKKFIIVLIVILGIITGIIYSGYALVNKNKKADGKRMFTMVDEKGALYTLNDGKEPVKLNEKESVFSKVKYIESIKKNIILDQEQNLFSVDKEGKRKDIASNVIKYEVNKNSKDSTIYYLDKDKGLYEINLEKGEPKKIESDIALFNIKGKDTLIYEKENYKEGFYIRKGNKDSEKVTGKFEFIYLKDEDSKLVIYEDNKCYVYDIDKKSKEEIPKEENEFLISLDSVKEGYMYSTISDTDYEKGCKLSFKKKDKKPIQLAYASQYMVLKYKKGAYYSTKEEGKYSLYYRDFNKNEAVKLYEGENKKHRFVLTKEKAYVLNNNDIEYKIGSDGKREKFYKDVKSDEKSGTEVCKDDIAYITENDDLYIGEHKIGEDVKKFQVVEDFLIYINKNNEVYLAKDNKKPELMIKNAKDYDRIYFDNLLIFKKAFEEEDLYGAWQQENNQKVMINFKKKLMNIVTEHSNVEFKYSVQNILSEKEINIKIENENKEVGEDLRKVLRVDKDTIKLNEVIYKRIAKDAFEEYAKKEKNAIDNINAATGAKYMGIDVKCTSVLVVGDKQYFLYESNEEENPSRKLIDEDGKGYVYNYVNWHFGGMLEEDTDYNKYYADREENKVVGYNENRVIDMSKIKSNSVDRINPTYMKWEDILEIAAKDFFKSRSDLNEGDVSFKGEIMDGSYYVEVMHNGKLVCYYEISPLDGTISRKR